MQSLVRRQIPPLPRDKSARPRFFKRLAGTALAGLMALTAVPGLARANDPSPYRVEPPNSKVVRLRDDANIFDAYHLNKNDDVKPSFHFELETDGIVTFHFYPYIPADPSAQGKIEREVRYTVNDTEHEVALALESSDLTPNDGPITGILIGRAAEIKITLSSGSNTIVVTSPSGLIRVVDFEVIETLPLVGLGPDPAPAPAPEAPLEEHLPDQESAQPYSSPVVSVRFVRIPFHAVREGNTNTPLAELVPLRPGVLDGQITTGDAWARVYPHDGSSWSLHVGAWGAFYDQRFTPDDQIRTFTGRSGGGQAGVLLHFDEHTLALGVLAGRWSIHTSKHADLWENPNPPDTNEEGLVLGGTAAYSYGHYVNLRAYGRTLPFQPAGFDLRLEAPDPIGWGRTHPYATVDGYIVPTRDITRSTTTRASTILGDDSLLTRALLGVPIWRLGPVTPALLGGIEADMLRPADRRALGGVGLDMEWGPVRLHGTAQIPFSEPVIPSFLLDASYLWP